MTIKHQSLSEYNTLVSQPLPRLRAEKLDLEVHVNDVNKKISKGREILEGIVADIKKVTEEHAHTHTYCVSALKERLAERWNMVYENNMFKVEAANFVSEVEDKPRYDYHTARVRR